MASPTFQVSLNEDENDNASDSKSSKLLQEEIKSAFTFLDVDKSGQISLANLKKRLGVFFPDMTPKEYKFLMNNRKELTIEDLNELLVENEISDADFDPVAEAFKVILHAIALFFVTNISSLIMSNKDYCRLPLTL